jgi:hypothetical protein
MEVSPSLSFLRWMIFVTITALLMCYRTRICINKLVDDKYFKT